MYIKATPRRSGTRSPSPSGPRSTATAARVEYDLRPGGAYRAFADRGDEGNTACPRCVVEGEVVEADPPRRLVQTWRMLFGPDHAGGAASRG